MSHPSFNSNHLTPPATPITDTINTHFMEVVIPLCSGKGTIPAVHQIATKVHIPQSLHPGQSVAKREENWLLTLGLNDLFCRPVWLGTNSYLPCGHRPINTTWSAEGELAYNFMLHIGHFSIFHMFTRRILTPQECFCFLLSSSLPQWIKNPQCMFIEKTPRYRIRDSTCELYVKQMESYKGIL